MIVSATEGAAVLGTGRGGLGQRPEWREVVRRICGKGLCRQGAEWVQRPRGVSEQAFKEQWRGSWGAGGKIQYGSL